MKVPAFLLRSLLLAFIADPALSQTDATRPSVQWSSYTEVFYAYDFNRPDNHERPAFLYNHNRHNEFNVNLAFLKAKMEGARTRGSLAFMAGTYANANLAGEPGVLKNLFEAQAGVRIAPKWWLDAGVMPSHIGFESAVSKDCWTLTRSLAAENSPYYESGLKTTFTPDSNWTISALVLNGWQRIRRPDGNSGPAFGLQITRTSGQLTLNYSAYAGAEFPDSVRRRRQFHNLYAIVQVHERFGVIAGFDLGAQQKPGNETGQDIWFTPVLISRYTLNDTWALSARAEYYQDVGGVIIAPETRLQGYSLNVDYKPEQHVLVRLEGRLLQSRDRIFQTQTGQSTSNFCITSSVSVSF